MSDLDEFRETMRVVEDEPLDERLGRGRLWIRVVAYLFGLSIILGAGAAGVGAYYFGKFGRDLPDYQVLAEYEPSITTRVHAGDGSLIGEFARERRLFVPRKGIPDNVVYAFLSAEDKNFYSHRGVDPMGVLRAAVANVSNYMNDRRLEGASTITQQVAKNFLLSSDMKFERKIKEAILALRIEQAFSKNQILELYLNEIYLGFSSYGVAAAALNYFDKSLDELTLAEAAYLAALPKAPNNYHPTKRKDRAMARRNWVLERMTVNGYVEKQASQLATEEDLVTVSRATGAQTSEVEYFVEEVRREVYSIYGEKSLYDGGLSIRTTLDTTLQTAAANALKSGLEAYDRRHGFRGALANLDLSTKATIPWQEQFEDVTIPRAIEPWEPAVVLYVDDTTAEIGFPSRDEQGTIPLQEIEWARKPIKNRKLGPEIKAASQVLHIGDVVLVEQVFISLEVEEEDQEAAVEDDEAAVDDVLNSQPVTVDDAMAEPVIEPDYYALRQIPNVNGGIVAIDPHTGRVLALAGGYSFDLSEFNRVTQAKRQPGSSFKPFVYAAALDNGFTPSSLVLDAPFVIDQGADKGFWKPDNYSDRFYGPSTLRLGVEKSRNVMTVRLAQEMGMGPIVDYARRFGIKDDMMPVLSMALGAGETTLLRLTTAYAMLVNGGKRIHPTLIDRIQDRHGDTIFRHDQRPCNNCAEQIWEGQEEPRLPDDRAQVIDARTAYQVVSMLEGVVQRGTGRSIRVVGKPLAGKTGTTNDERDAWFVGFAPDLAVGVYVGFDTPLAMGRRETGGAVAAPVFRDFMQAAIGSKPAIPFRTPEGLRMVRVNRDTGLLAGANDRNVILEAFKPGTEPTDVAPEVVGGDPLFLSGDTSLLGVGATEVETGTGGLY